ncbi:distal tail protein Dit [Halobacillus sp. BBL2006]|uniref:distal tail protein Dit n=1 Tax=Halobacillus sp. BBL2006 TaxID=1543706 RepID=UPI000543BE8F|nr:distal tail protein Dit [Halobacillus sp. BBL2006]KHE73151.1 hypothetical protein LD39_00735 [Halobacillus sp. BBL2006]
MPRKSFTFNGVRKPWLHMTRGRTKPPFAPIRRETLEVPGMPGAYLRSSETEPLIFDQPIAFKAKDDEEALQYKDELSSWLITEEAAPLEFDDEPGRTYYAVVLNTIDDLSKIADLREGTIHFACYNPYSYGEQDIKDFEGDALTLNNPGTAESKPRFEIDVLEDVTHIDLVKKLDDDIEFIRLGRPPLASETEYERETLVMHDTCETTNGWTQAAAIDNGYVAGSIKSEGGRFKPELFGGAIEPYTWQGPAIKRSIGASLQAYKMDALVELKNVGKGTGMIEIYLLDANNNVVSKVGIEDIWRTMDKVQAKFQLGPVGEDRFQHYREPKYPWGWNDFKGILRIWSHDHYSHGKRRIRPYFGLVGPNGKHDWVAGDFVYLGPPGIYDNPITQVQVAFRIWAPTYDKADMNIEDIKVYRMNPYPTDGVQYLARAGDKIIIDTATEEITLNGEPIRSERALGSMFFELDPGENLLYQYPQNSLATKVYYSPAYK